jgi:hypothetical protein
MEETLARILATAAERKLPFLLIGGNAVILPGYPRNTIDIDFLVPAARRSQWLDAMHALAIDSTTARPSLRNSRPVPPACTRSI